MNLSFGFLSHSYSKSPKSIHFSFRPFTSKYSDKIFPITQTKIYLVFKKIDRGYVCILEGMHEENIFKNNLFGCLGTNNERTTLYFHKLDGVGPVDNRPSTDQFHHLAEFFVRIIILNFFCFIKNVKKKEKYFVCDR